MRGPFFSDPEVEKKGVVGPPNHSGKREILVGNGVERGAFEEIDED